MKGKTLKSIEGEFQPKYKHFRELVRFNLGQFAVEVYSYEEEVEWYWNSDTLFQDEATCFTVFKKDMSGRSYPQGWSVVKFLKDENVYTFSRCDLNSYAIHMEESDKIDMYYSVKDAKEDCSDSESGLKAKVKREYIFL